MTRENRDIQDHPVQWWVLKALALYSFQHHAHSSIIRRAIIHA